MTVVEEVRTENGSHPIETEKNALLGWPRQVWLELGFSLQIWQQQTDSERPLISVALIFECVSENEPRE